MSVSGEALKGRGVLAVVVTGIWSSFSDVHWELNDPVVETGVFWTLDDDGLVAEERSHFDVTAVAMQLGLIG